MIFYDDLKLAIVSPILKKQISFNKENYRPDNMMPKVFEKIP